LNSVYKDTPDLIKLNITRLDINGLIQQAADEMEFGMSRKNIGLALVLAGEEQSALKLTDESQSGAGSADELQSGLMVSADKTAIERVLFNLLDNAIKFVPQNGSIRISSRKSESESENGNIVEVIVENSGDFGIVPDEYMKIFEKSYRGGNADLYEGQGLGLFICKELISAHNQKIWPGKSDLGGAKFTFTLSME